MPETITALDIERLEAAREGLIATLQACESTVGQALANVYAAQTALADAEENSKHCRHAIEACNVLLNSPLVEHLH